MRVFYVCSYGGCASRMICKFLGKHYIVYHIHSRYPPMKLCSIKKTKMTGKFEWFNYLNVLKKKYRDNITVIYLYRKPSTSLLSRMGWGKCHFSNINLNTHGLTKFLSKDINARLKYSKIQKDLLGLNNFFKNYVNKGLNKNYSIHCIKYETLWENLEDIFKKLNIPKEYIEEFPKKYEKELDERQLEVKENLENKYKKLENYMDVLPPYFIIPPRR